MVVGGGSVVVSGSVSVVTGTVNVVVTGRVSVVTGSVNVVVTRVSVVMGRARRRVRTVTVVAAGVVAATAAGNGVVAVSTWRWFDSRQPELGRHGVVGGGVGERRRGGMGDCGVTPWDRCGVEGGCGAGWRYDGGGGGERRRVG